VVGGVGLGSSDSVEDDKHGWFNGNAVIQEWTDDLLQACHLAFVERRAGVKIRCVLNLCTVGWLIPFVGCIFTAGWHVVLELVKSSRNIVRHGDVIILRGVVPFDGEATLKFAFPVGRDDVKVLEGFDEVVGIVFSNVLDTKVVNNKAE
jgi:hypothetical protein